MQKEHIYYAIIGAGALTVIVIACIFFWPERKLPSPKILEEKILGGSEVEVEVQRQAAQDIARHGTVARVEVRRTLEKYSGEDPVVKVALIEATVGNQDWQSMPELFQAMESSYPVIRARAAAAVEEIMGLQFFYRADDPPEKRAKVLKEMRSEYEEMVRIGRFQDVYSDQTE